jgi:adenine specific DNA methylase Mod
LISYKSNQDGFTLMEQKNNEDFEFTIVIKDTERYLPEMKRLREHYNLDNVYTDVLFYVHKDHEYQIIVRQDTYIDFVLSLFKYKFIQSIAWSS